MGRAAYSQRRGEDVSVSSYWAMRTAARVPGLARGEQLGERPAAPTPPSRGPSSFRVSRFRPDARRLHCCRPRSRLGTGLGRLGRSYDRLMVQARSSRIASRLLRRRRAGRRDRRAGARALRRACLRPASDRSQRSRRARPRGARRGLRRERGRGARGRDDRLLRTRRRAGRPRALRPQRKLNTIDATCPLVTKVHVQARRYAAEGYTVVLIGHAGHEEVEGTMGEAPESIVLVESVDGRRSGSSDGRTRSSRTSRRRRSPSTRRGRSSPRCARRFPRDPRAANGGHLLRDLQPAVGGEGDARARRRAARDRLAELVELERRLVDVAARSGVPAYLIDDESDIDEALVRRRRDGRTDERRERTRECSSSACARGSARAASPEIEAYQMVDEDVTFRLPVELRRELALAESQPLGLLAGAARRARRSPRACPP